MKTGDRLTLAIDKPAAGGRMIARHDGAIVLVSGAIPGEVVEAIVEKVQRGTGWARTLRVLEPSLDRVAVDDWSCGGNVLAHVAYERQLVLKRQIIQDAFARIGRMQVPDDLDVAASPVEGYRMRARLHVVRGRIGFYREGTHELCDVAGARQLLPQSIEVLRVLEGGLTNVAGNCVEEIELSENCDAGERALHLSLRGDADPSCVATLPQLAGLRGVSCGVSFRTRPLVLWGTPEVTDTFAIARNDGGTATVTLTRQAHSFFQGNRYLLTPLLNAVIGEVLPGRVLDLYAGVGVFAAALAVRGGHEVTAIEGDRTSAQDLKRNAAQAGDLDARHQSVETFLSDGRVMYFENVIVDPPRTGMTKEAMRGALALRPTRLIYVSCDVATLARDARLIVDSGYTLRSVRAFDLFPNTGHVESLVTFEK